jgi:hypothetical protein
MMPDMDPDIVHLNAALAALLQARNRSNALAYLSERLADEERAQNVRAAEVAGMKATKWQIYIPGSSYPKEAETIADVDECLMYTDDGDICSVEGWVQITHAYAIAICHDDDGDDITVHHFPTRAEAQAFWEKDGRK